jgi:3-hydroxybutyryl-CoA dehydratase
MDDRHGYYFEDLSPGMSAVFSKTVTEADLLMFAGVSGDTNPLHLDEDFASRTMFESRIAHGMLTASLVSTVLGTRLPERVTRIGAAVLFAVFGLLLLMEGVRTLG